MRLPQATSRRRSPKASARCCAKASSSLVRAPRLGRRGVRLLVAIVVDRLGRHVDLPGSARRAGRGAALRPLGRHHPAGPALPLPFPIDTVLFPKVTQINQVQLGNAERARRPRERTRAADADRRREHRRGRLRGVLEDPRRRRVPVPRQRARGGGEDRRGGRAARRHQPHADPGGDVRQAPADRRRDARRCCSRCSTPSTPASRSPRCSCSASNRRWR